MRTDTTGGGLVEGNENEMCDIFHIHTSIAPKSSPQKILKEKQIAPWINFVASRKRWG